MEIGDKLPSGEKHDGRAPDYDDWHLNGDILVYYPLLDMAFELSSMGIRVDEEALREQCAKAGCEDRLNLDFHKAILNKELPCSMGGGIGQSRLCMFMPVSYTHLKGQRAYQAPREPNSPLPSP